MPDKHPELVAEHASIGYGGQPVVEDLNLVIPKGKFTALLGPNGSGKSTILRSLAGLHRLEAGAILLNGQPIARLPTKAVARRIGFLAQGAAAPDGLTVADLVRQGRYPHRHLLGGWTAADSLAVDEAMALTSIAHLRDRRLDTLSGGQRQRAWIAMTLAQQGSILLLDEPTTYLDLAHQIGLMELTRYLIETRDATVVAVLHEMNQAARYADHLVLLKAGRIHAEGAPAEVLTAENMQTVFGVAVAILTDPETGQPLCVPRRHKHDLSVI